MNPGERAAKIVSLERRIEELEKKLSGKLDMMGRLDIEVECPRCKNVPDYEVGCKFCRNTGRIQLKQVVACSEDSCRNDATFDSDKCYVHQDREEEDDEDSDDGEDLLGACLDIIAAHRGGK